jgi:SpoVK/Ycf46/Vps4 family AAA+-type ATPase
MSKTINRDFDNPRRNFIYPLDYAIDVNRPMTKEQKKILVELLYSRFTDPDDLEEKLAAIDDTYSYADAAEIIRDFASLLQVR